MVYRAWSILAILAEVTVADRKRVESTIVAEDSKSIVDELKNSPNSNAPIPLSTPAARILTSSPCTRSPRNRRTFDLRRLRGKPR